MVLYINDTGLFFQVYSGMNEITGSVFLTLFLIVIIIMLLAFMFRIPVEFTMILILPMLLTFLAFESEFLAVAGVILIYLGIIVAKHLFFNR